MDRIKTFFRDIQKNEHVDLTLFVMGHFFKGLFLVFVAVVLSPFLLFAGLVHLSLWWDDYCGKR